MPGQRVDEQAPRHGQVILVAVERQAGERFGAGGGAGQVAGRQVDLRGHQVAGAELEPAERAHRERIEQLERAIDAAESELEPLTTFILPGGTALGALLHVARTVSRRAERAAWSAIDANPEDTSVLPAKYLNRLSDLLFIMGRVANPEGDVLWKPGAGA